MSTGNPVAKGGDKIASKLLSLYPRKPLKMSRYCFLFLLYFPSCQTLTAQPPVEKVKLSGAAASSNLASKNTS